MGWGGPRIAPSHVVVSARRWPLPPPVPTGPEPHMSDRRTDVRSRGRLAAAVRWAVTALVVLAAGGGARRPPGRRPGRSGPGRARPERAGPEPERRQPLGVHAHRARPHRPRSPQRLHLPAGRRGHASTTRSPCGTTPTAANFVLYATDALNTPGGGVRPPPPGPGPHRGRDLGEGGAGRGHRPAPQRHDRAVHPHGAGRRQSRAITPVAWWRPSRPPERIPTGAPSPSTPASACPTYIQVAGPLEPGAHRRARREPLPPLGRTAWARASWT